MIEHSSDVKDLFAAIHKAQGALSGVAKDSTNPHFKNRYASLENVIDAAKPALQANGLAFTQAPGALVDGAIEITTMLMHASGQWLRSTLHVPLAKRDPQGVGSAITYGCRYSLMATLGLPPVDDDAESATDRTPRREAERRPVERAAPQEGVITSGRQFGSTDAMLDAARAAATNGTEAFRTFWKERALGEKATLKPYLTSLEKAAKQADIQAEGIAA